MIEDKNIMNICNKRLNTETIVYKEITEKKEVY